MGTGVPLLHTLRRRFSTSGPFGKLGITLSIRLRTGATCLYHILTTNNTGVCVANDGPLSARSSITTTLMGNNLGMFTGRNTSTRRCRTRVRGILRYNPGIVVSSNNSLMGAVRGRCPSLADNIVNNYRRAAAKVVHLGTVRGSNGLHFPVVTIGGTGYGCLFSGQCNANRSM